jgi:hypothetical protein
MHVLTDPISQKIIEEKPSVTIRLAAGATMTSEPDKKGQVTLEPGALVKAEDVPVFLEKAKPLASPSLSPDSRIWMNSRTT